MLRLVFRIILQGTVRTVYYHRIVQNSSRGLVCAAEHTCMGLFLDRARLSAFETYT